MVNSEMRRVHRTIAFMWELLQQVGFIFLQNYLHAVYFGEALANFNSYYILQVEMK